MSFSSGSGLSSGSNGPKDLLQAIYSRKQRRMLSNRESARRSRLRKQKLMDDLASRAARLRQENNQIIANYRAIVEKKIAVESDNCELRAHVAALSRRLELLNEIIIGQSSSQAVDSFFVNPWNQPFLSSPDMLQY